MTVALSLSPCSEYVNHATKNETHLSTDVNEILVHVYIHLYIHWGRFDNVHGSITGEALIPVCTPIFKQYSLFSLCQRHSILLNGCFPSSYF